MKTAMRVVGSGADYTASTFRAGLQATYADYPLSPNFGAGLFASFAIGRYTYQGGEVSGTGMLDGTSGGGLGSDTTNHTWFTIGLRGKFDL